MGIGILLIMLGHYAIEDIKKRRITVWYLPIFGGLGVVLQAISQNRSVAEIFLGVGVGLAICLLSRCTGGSIGAGDGLILTVTGIFLGGSANVELLMTGLLYAAVFSLGILIFGKKNRRQEIPFVPFLFLGYLTMIVIGTV